MLPLLTLVDFVLLGMVMFILGWSLPVLRTGWYRRRLKRRRAARTQDSAITKDDIRNELCRDPVATELFMNDSTPEDVQRYLYLEAERRAIMRRDRQLREDENDFFAPPRRGGPDPGYRNHRR